MIKILVTGAGGQLGSEFQKIASGYGNIEFLFCSKSDLDISNEKALQDLSTGFSPDYVINCAAYTLVDKAEEEAGLCYRINSGSCRAMAEVFSGTKTKVVHYSSDYVYHSNPGQLLTEDSPTTPVSVYAKSKLEGENWFRQSQVPALILRTSWVYAKNGSNFLNTMLRLSQSKEKIQVVYDQIGTPTYTEDLALITLKIILQTHDQVDGIVKFNETYNYSNEGVTSWYDFATYIFKKKNIKTQVLPILSSQYPTLAKRPGWSLMSKKKIKETFQVQIPHWMDGVDRCLYDEALTSKSGIKL